MEIREIKDSKIASEWNRRVQHPLQAYEWGEFRRQTGIQVVRYGIFENDKLVEPIQITIHPIPKTKWTVGYAPRAYPPSKRQTQILAQVARDYNCIHIKLEPLQESEGKTSEDMMHKLGLVAGRSLFTPYNFVLELGNSEEELLAQMKQKTRYNIRLAKKKGVEVELDNSPDAFSRYLALTEETTRRQGFYAHSRDYHRKMFETLHPAGIAQLLVARHNGQIITTWVLFRFGDTLYYPYGASTRESREVMANNLVMFEAIKLAQKWKLAKLDMWGALGANPDPRDPWYGFHTFKAGYGARHVQYVGTWDYVHKPLLYRVFRVADRLRWMILRTFR